MESGSNIRDFICGILFLLASSFLLFTDIGRNLFNPFEDCPGCLQFYYYLIAYGLAFAGIFLIIRGFGIIKH